jgi:hypothetical protein
MATLKLTLSLCIFGAIIVLCLVRLDLAGVSALSAGALGFVGGYLTPGQSTVGERIGNAYIGAFVGLCLGFALGGLGQLIWQKFGA